MVNSASDLDKFKARLRRRCRQPELRRVIEEALRDPALLSARYTTSGVMLRGPYGSASTHFTNSDHRALKNFTSALRRAGISTRGYR